MDIVWRRQAEHDLERIFDFILQHDPGAARHLCDRIERRVAQLRDHPHLGRPGRVAGTRELVVAGTPYIVAYRVAASRIAAVLSDNGREFCGRPDRHPYELFLQLEDIAHKTTRVRRPQSNGIVERLHRTLLDEHFRVEGRRT